MPPILTRAERRLDAAPLAVPASTSREEQAMYLADAARRVLAAAEAGDHALAERLGLDLARLAVSLEGW